MKRRSHVLTVIAVLIAAVATGAALTASGAEAKPQKLAAGELKGAGATFPAPLIAVWQQRYEAAKQVKITYNPIGSGGGISAITNKTVDFGASDAPLSIDQFSACGGCIQIPWVLSATSVMYNVEGVKNNLRVTGPILADIYLGKVTNWNDARLRRINPGAEPPRPQDHARSTAATRAVPRTTSRST